MHGETSIICLNCLNAESVHGKMHMFSDGRNYRRIWQEQRRWKCNAEGLALMLSVSPSALYKRTNSALKVLQIVVCFSIESYVHANKQVVIVDTNIWAAHGNLYES
jgi:hypothetical protein